MKDFSEFKDKLLSSIGKAADAGKEFAEKAADAGKEFAEKAADKAKNGTRIAKLSIEIASEKENMKKAYIEIGKLYYDTHKDAPEGLFIQLCEEVTLAQDNITAKETEIEELKKTCDCADDSDIEVDFEEVVSGDENAVETEEEPNVEEAPEADAAPNVEEAPAEEVPETPADDKTEE